MIRQNIKLSTIMISFVFPSLLFANEEFYKKSFLTQVGAENIHIPPPGAKITALLALPGANEGHIEDFNSYGPNQVYPEIFTLSDGTILTPFIYVDMSEASPLRKIVTMHAKEITSTTENLEEQLTLLKSYVSEKVFSPVPENDPILKSSDQGIPFFSEVENVGGLPAGHFPIAVPFKAQTVRFESLIEYGRGFCIHKVLLTSLIMKELGIPHAIRFGSTGSYGHNWIKLPDGRILEPTWQLLVQPATSDSNGDWFTLSRTRIYQYDYYPFAVWSPLP